jgi:hypothetical protein
MATNSRVTPIRGRFRESRWRGRGAAPRATAPGTLVADAIAGAPLVFAAVRGRQPDARGGVAVADADRRETTRRPCRAVSRTFSAGFYLQTRFYAD